MAELTIEIGAKVDEALKALNDLKGGVKEIGEQASTGKLALAEFLGVFAERAFEQGLELFKEGFEKVVELIKESVSISSEAGKALNDFNVSLALAGQYSQETSQKFQEFAEDLSKNSDFTKENILKNAALMESLAKLSEDGLEKAMMAAVELGSRTGDLGHATNLLTRAAEGSTTMLSRYGINIRATGDAVTDFNASVNETIRVLGGESEGQMYTFSAQVNLLKKAWDELLITIGNLITKNPIVVGVISAMVEIFEHLTAAVQRNHDYLLDLMANGFEKLINLIPTLVKGLATLYEGFETGLNIITFWKDQVMGIEESILRFILSIDKVQAKLPGFLGGNNSDQIQNAQANIDAVVASRDENAQIVADRISSYESMNSAADKFSKDATAIIKQNLKEASDLYNQDLEDYLERLNKKHEAEEASRKSGLQALQKDLSGDKKEQNIANTIRGQIGSYASNPFQNDPNKSLFVSNLSDHQKKIYDSLTDQEKSQLGLLDENQESEYKRNKGIGQGIGFTGDVLQGAAGAPKAIAGGIGIGIDALTGIPGLGQALGPVMQALMGGPDAVRGLVKAFADAVPDLIANLIEAIPVVIEELANKIPIVIQRLVQEAPNIIKKLIEESPKLISSLISMTPQIIMALAIQSPMIILELVKNVPTIVGSFISSFINGVPKIIDSIADGVWNALKNITGSGKSGIPIIGGAIDNFSNQISNGHYGSAALGIATGGLSEALGIDIGFAKGGQGFTKSVPAGFPNDSFPARLSSGELVVDPSTSEKLKNFLDDGQDMTNILLTKILDAVSAPINVSSDVKLNASTFANILVGINRTNLRTF